MQRYEKRTRCKLAYSHVLFEVAIYGESRYMSERSELRILHCVDVVNLLVNSLLLRVSNLVKAKL